MPRTARSLLWPDPGAIPPASSPAPLSWRDAVARLTSRFGEPRTVSPDGTHRWSVVAKGRALAPVHLVLDPAITGRLTLWMFHPQLAPSDDCVAQFRLDSLADLETALQWIEARL